MRFIPGSTTSYTALDVASTPTNFGNAELRIDVIVAPVWCKLATSSTDATAGTENEIALAVGTHFLALDGSVTWVSLIENSAGAKASITTGTYAG